MALDAPKTIDVPMHDDNKIIIARRDPFGLIYLTLEKGTLPERFQGAYTTVEYAMEDALKYKDQRKLEIEEMNKPVEVTNLPKAKSKAA